MKRIDYLQRLKSGKLDLGVRRDILDWIWKEHTICYRMLGGTYLIGFGSQQFHIAFNKQVAVEEIKKFEVFTKIVEDLRGRKIIKLPHT
ncbi:hypothetical protein DEO72_LG8g2029 [Vigna unguiculata]|uniref:Uncharacterized protein n=1 Tax=Vigna unguiculata TaxID=3917 RepID=A0A4D6MVS5_VIGUN|nr:hypothetical protein DEO72_LG8g2029 [Vigna unguiculata]